MIYQPYIDRLYPIFVYNTSQTLLMIKIDINSKMQIDCHIIAWWVLQYFVPRKWYETALDICIIANFVLNLKLYQFDFPSLIHPDALYELSVRGHSKSMSLTHVGRGLITKVTNCDMGGGVWVKVWCRTF